MTKTTGIFTTPSKSPELLGRVYMSHFDFKKYMATDFVSFVNEDQREIGLYAVIGVPAT